MTTLRRSLAAALLAVPAVLLVAQPASARDHRSHRDVRDPVITDVTPDHRDRVGDRGRTQVAARFHDAESGVASVRLRLNGRDVTHASRIAGNQIRYRDDLRPGRYVAEVVVRDRAGNTSRRTWQFAVTDRGHRNYGYAQPNRR